MSVRSGVPFSRIDLNRTAGRDRQRIQVATCGSAGIFYVIALEPVGGGKRPSSRNQRLDEIPDVVLELLVGHARLADLGQLHEADVGGVGQARAVGGGVGVEAGLAERVGDEVDAPLRDAFDERADQRLVDGLEQRGEDRVRLALVADLADQCAQAFARVGDGRGRCEHLGFVVTLPAVDGGLDQRLARREVPVEAALGHAQAPRERLDGDRGESALGQRFERGAFPVGG